MYTQGNLQPEWQKLKYVGRGKEGVELGISVEA